MNNARNRGVTRKKDEMSEGEKKNKVSL